MGRIVAALREERLMSRYALAKRAGVDCSWLRRFEQGRSGVRVETLIAKAIIQGRYAEGSTLTVDYDGNALVLK